MTMVASNFKLCSLHCLRRKTIYKDRKVNGRGKEGVTKERQSLQRNKGHWGQLVAMIWTDEKVGKKSLPTTFSGSMSCGHFNFRLQSCVTLIDSISDGAVCCGSLKKLVHLLHWLHLGLPSVSYLCSCCFKDPQRKWFSLETNQRSHWNVSYSSWHPPTAYRWSYCDLMERGSQVKCWGPLGASLPESYGKQMRPAVLL